MSNKNPAFAALLNARPASWRLRSETPEAEACVKHIATRLKELYKRSPPKPRQLSAAVRWVVLNLMNVRYSDPMRYVAINMGANAFRTGFGYRILKRVVTGMAAQGLVECHPGFKDRATGKGYRTRIRANGRLTDLCWDVGLAPHLIESKLNGPLVRLRSSKSTSKRSMRWPRDPASQLELKRMTENVRAINEFLSRSFIGLNVPDGALQEINEELDRKNEEHTWVDFSRKRLYRVFNDGSTKLGGRLVGGWWQVIPSGYRKHIHIAAPGEAPLWNVELDFSSLQPTLLYIQERVHPPDDCYAINDRFLHSRAARDYAKTTLLVMLNAADRPSAVRAIQDRITQRHVEAWQLEHPGTPRPRMTIEQMIPDGCPNITQLIDELTKYHEPIAKHFCSDVGKRLMYIESTIAESVILSMQEWGCVTLPVHDSFLVRKGNQFALRETMQRVFREIMGAECQIQADETELDEHRQIYGPDKDHWSLVRTNGGLMRGGLFDAMVKDWTNQQTEIRRGYGPEQDETPLLVTSRL